MANLYAVRYTETKAAVGFIYCTGGTLHSFVEAITDPRGCEFAILGYGFVKFTNTRQLTMGVPVPKGELSAMEDVLDASIDGCFNGALTGLHKLKWQAVKE